MKVWSKPNSLAECQQRLASHVTDTWAVVCLPSTCACIITLLHPTLLLFVGFCISLYIGLMMKHTVFPNWAKGGMVFLFFYMGFWWQGLQWLWLTVIGYVLLSIAQPQ